MKRYRPLQFALISLTVATLAVQMPIAGAVAASSTMTVAQQDRLKTIISKGDQEISRRLDKLSQLSSKISSATRLSSADKATLTTQVTNEISGLTALRTKLDAETTVAAAGVDAKAIFDDYRVYALIVPKINLVRVADDQQGIEAKLANVITALQTNLTAAKNAGKDVTSLQTQLDTATSQQKAALALSAAVQAKVISLQPTDYDSDHTILSGQNTQLTTARTDIKAVYTALVAVRDGLKKLS